MSIFSQLNDASDGNRRRELAREVANLFFVAEANGLQHKQIDDFGHIMCCLLDEMQIDERVQLSTSMATSQNAPHDLALTLAGDDIRVAGPMLENSQVLTEEDLVHLADQKGMEHRLAMSRREHLTAKVTDRLISHEESEVLRSVAGNQTAEISQDGYSTLVRHSPEDAALAACLAKRVDLPEEAARQLLPLLDDEQRRKVAAMISQNGGAALREMVTKAKTQSSTRKIDASAQRIEGKSLAKQIELGTMRLADAASRLARERKPRALALVFAEASMLPESQMFGAVVNADADLTMLLCRALELPFDVFTEIDEMRCATLKLEHNEASDAMRAKYEAITVENARKTMRFVNLMVKAS